MKLVTMMTLHQYHSLTGPTLQRIQLDQKILSCSFCSPFVDFINCQHCSAHRSDNLFSLFYAPWMSTTPFQSLSNLLMRDNKHNICHCYHAAYHADIIGIIFYRQRFTNCFIVTMVLYLGLFSHIMLDSRVFVESMNKNNSANIIAWVEIEPTFCGAVLLFAVRWWII